MSLSLLREGSRVLVGLCVVSGLCLAAERPFVRPVETVVGILEVFQVDDFSSSAASVRLYELTDIDTGERHRLRLSGQPPRRLLSGSIVRARGVRLDRELHVDGVEVLEAPATVAQVRSVVVLVVDFDDHAVACSDASIAGLMFDGLQSVGGLYDEVSYGNVTLARDTDGDGQADVFRVSVGAQAGAGCDPTNWATAADAAAAAAGVNLSLYRHRLYVIPAAAGCGWAGLANLGCGTFCRAWVRTCQFPDVYAHELGHNLGMGHASTDVDHDGIIDSEYGDHSDFMGIGGVGYRHLNGAHKDQLAWVPASQVVVAEEGTQNYVLGPLHLPPSQVLYPQLLRISRPGGGDDYVVSYRQRGGYDTTLGAEYADRSSVHTHGGGSSNTLLVAALSDGAQLDDPAGGVSIAQVAHDPLSVTLLVTVAPLCAVQPPALRVAPDRAVAAPSASAEFAVTVTNQDSASCEATTFRLSSTAPAGWSANASAGSLRLDPGQSGTLTLDVAVPQTATDGAYAIDVHVGDGVDATHDAQSGVAVTVDGIPPEAVTGLVGSSRAGHRVWLVWNPASDAASEVAGYRVYRDGAVVGSPNYRRFVDHAVASGTSYRYSVTAVDAAGNESGPGEDIEIRVVSRVGEPRRSSSESRR